MIEAYDTQGDIGKVYRVEFTGDKSARIYKICYDTHYEPAAYCLYQTILRYKEAFIGSNDENNINIGYPRDSIRRPYQSINNDYDGSSILIKIDKYKYCHIGISAIVFTTEEELNSYFSSVDGNTPVPYPYARGKKYSYLLSPVAYYKILNTSIPEDVAIGDLYYHKDEYNLPNIKFIPFDVSDDIFQHIYEI